MVVEAQDFEALGAQIGISTLVVGFALGVLIAVEFDDEARAQASEVGDVWADWALTAKSVACELALAEARPEPLLSVGGVRSQPSGEVSGLGMLSESFAQLCRPCLLSPRRGEIQRGAIVALSR